MDYIVIHQDLAHQHFEAIGMSAIYRLEFLKNTTRINSEYFIDVLEIIAEIPHMNYCLLNLVCVKYLLNWYFLS